MPVKKKAIKNWIIYDRLRIDSEPQLTFIKALMFKTKKGES